MIHNPWMILGLLFLAMAALGIPLLWISRAFSWPVKLILTVVVTIYTAILLWLFWLVMVWSYTNIQESLAL